MGSEMCIRDRSEAMIVGGDIQAKMLASCNRHSQFLLAEGLSVNYLGSSNPCQPVCGCPLFFLTNHNLKS